MLVDSTGIKMIGEGEWKTKNMAPPSSPVAQGPPGIDASTLEIRVIEVMDNSNGDAPTLPCLLEQMGTDEVIASARGDGA